MSLRNASISLIATLVASEIFFRRLIAIFGLPIAASKASTQAADLYHLA